MAQALVTLARLGAAVGFVGRIGDDEPGDLMRQSLAEEGVDLSRLQIEPRGHLRPVHHPRPRANWEAQHLRLSRQCGGGGGGELGSALSLLGTLPPP